MGIDPTDTSPRMREIADRYLTRGALNPIQALERNGGTQAIAPRNRPRKGKTELLKTLGPKHKLIIEKMVFGLDRAHPDFPWLAPGQPLSAENIADLYNLKRRYVRALLEQTVFVTALNQVVAAMRTGAKPLAVRKMIELIGHVGDGKAADAKVALDAAKAVLGEKDSALTVNVGVQVGVNNVTIQPGYVIDLGAPATPPTIDATANQRTSQIDR